MNYGDIRDEQACLLLEIQSMETYIQRVSEDYGELIANMYEDYESKVAKLQELKELKIQERLAKQIKLISKYLENIGILANYDQWSD